MTMAEAITAGGLTKAFGRTRALAGLDLTVHTGEVLIPAAKSVL